MTEQRSFKTLVRERMEHTGESYVTARGRLLAQRPASAPDGVTGGYRGFEAAEHRASGLARGMLAQAGLDLSEAMVCGLGGGIGFMYAIFEYKQVPHPLLTIVAQHHPQPWLEAIAQHAGIRMSSVSSSTPDAALRKLDATLERGQAAQLAVGRGLLPWHPDVPAEEAATPWEIVVAGRNGDDYLMDEADGEERRIDADTLATAWAAHRKGKFAIVTVDPITEPVDLAAASRAAIATTVAHLTGPVLGHAFDVNFGLSGMAKWVDELRNARTKDGWLKRFGSPEAFRIGMTRIDECLTWQYTAEGATRPIYARFLSEAGASMGVDLSTAVTDALAAGEVWRAVAAKAREASASGAEPADTFARLADQVEQALHHERSLVAELASL
jgi:hypothetical protein